MASGSQMTVSPPAIDMERTWPDGAVVRKASIRVSTREAFFWRECFDDEGVVASPLLLLLDAATSWVRRPSTTSCSNITWISVCLAQMRNVEMLAFLLARSA